MRLNFHQLKPHMNAHAQTHTRTYTKCSTNKAFKLNEFPKCWNKQHFHKTQQIRQQFLCVCGWQAIICCTKIHQHLSPNPAEHCSIYSPLRCSCYALLPHVISLAFTHSRCTVWHSVTQAARVVRWRKDIKSGETHIQFCANVLLTFLSCVRCRQRRRVAVKGCCRSAHSLISCAAGQDAGCSRSREG